MLMDTAGVRTLRSASVGFKARGHRWAKLNEWMPGAQGPEEPALLRPEGGGTWGLNSVPRERGGQVLEGLLAMRVLF